MATKVESRDSGATAPEQLLVVFTRGRIAFWMAVAVLVHVVVIGATSLGYIRDQWIDPEGAKLRKEAAAAALAAEKAKARAPVKPAGTNAAPQAVAASNAPAGVVTGAAPATATGTVTTAVAGTNAAAASGDEASELAARRNTTVVKRITESASSNEIPKKPELGISLEDTNLR